MSKAPSDIKEGDDVSWKYGSGEPSGEVIEVDPSKHDMETKNGSSFYLLHILNSKVILTKAFLLQIDTVTKNGTEENPAVGKICPFFFIKH